MAYPAQMAFKTSWPQQHQSRVTPSGAKPQTLRWRAVRFAVHCAIGLLFLLLFLRQVDPAIVLAEISRVRQGPVLIALFAYGLDFLLRAARFWVLLDKVSGQRLPWWRVPAPFIASFGISDILPLRAGDLFRLLWFQRQMTLPTSAVLGAMMVERFYDLFALLLLAAGLFSWHFGTGWPIFLALLAGFVAVTALVIQMGDWAARRDSAHEGWIGRVLNGLFAAIKTFRILRAPRLFVGLMGISLICWLLEAMVLMGAWIGLGGTMNQWMAPMAAFVASTLGTLLPGLPGHFGTFELFGMEMFRRGGVTQDFAAAVLLLTHMLLWMPTALFAIFWLPFRGSGKAA